MKGRLYAGLCIALWALIPVVSKAGQHALDHYQFLFWSSLISWLTLLAVALMRGALRPLRTMKSRDYLVIAGLGLLGTFLYYLLLYQGYRQAEGMSVLVLQYTWPLFIAGLSVWLLGEALSLSRLGALTLGLVAVVLVLSRGQFERLTLSPEPALLWVLAGAFCFALFSVLSKQVHYEPVLLNMLFFAVALLASAGAMFGFSSFRVPEGDAWWSVLANGVLVNGISYLFWLNALRLRPASELAVLVFLTPVLSTVYLYLLYRDEFLPVYWVAIGCIVVAGMMTVSRREAA